MFVLFVSVVVVVVVTPNFFTVGEKRKGRPPPKILHLQVGGVRWAGKQMTGGVVTCAAGGVGRVPGFADPRSV